MNKMTIKRVPTGDINALEQYFNNEALRMVQVVTRNALNKVRILVDNHIDLEGDRVCLTDSTGGSVSLGMADVLSQIEDHINSKLIPQTRADMVSITMEHLQNLGVDLEAIIKEAVDSLEEEKL